MHSDFKEFISRRCQRAIEECKEYIKNEMNNNMSSDELQIMAETLCYEKGFKDAMAILKYSQVI